MIARPLLLAAALLAASATAALAQARDVVAPPTLRANVTVASDIVRVGDLVENAGIAGATAVYRAPDLAPQARCRSRPCLPSCAAIR
jgi:flagella basal body P-ring formation protein FlgA